MLKELKISAQHNKHKQLWHIWENTEVISANQKGVANSTHCSVSWGMVSLALSGYTKRRLSQVRDTELFICTAVCTVKNRDVILHVYNSSTSMHQARPAT